MNKITLITDKTITVASDRDGIVEYNLSCCNFTPSLDDSVIIEVVNGKTKISKYKPELETTEFKGCITVLDIKRAIYEKIGYNSKNSNQYITNQDTQMAGRAQHQVGKYAYIFLCLFFGMFGAHKFYSGYTKQGILYLLFCWTMIPLFLSLVEIFRVLPKRTDIQGNFIV